MMAFDAKKWIRITLYGLLLVACLGALMRYKISFSFPFFDQKHVQHAHSHFAFSGWVSQMLMIFLVQLVSHSSKRMHRYQQILVANLILAYSMLIAFTIQGYGTASIFLSTSSILLSIYFAYCYWQDLRYDATIIQQQWFLIALACNILSSAGTSVLAWMMATKSFEQHIYLASVYWYLHFQYNGWFFFTCMGLFVQYFHRSTGKTINPRVWQMLGLSVFPAYGLSTLWLPLPGWLYLVIVAATVIQFAAWILFMKEMTKHFSLLAKLTPVTKGLVLYLAIATTFKISLQLGSVIPVVSKFAFGFRPVVIAYLHLVLLAITSIFLISYALLEGFIPDEKPIRKAIIFFAAGVLLNELVLGIQGIASISYTLVPYANEMLLFIALFIIASLVSLIRAVTKATAIH